VTSATALIVHLVFVPTNESTTLAVVIIDAAISVIESAVTFVAVWRFGGITGGTRRSSACRAFGRFVRGFVDVLVAIATRALHLTGAL
jgi:hypothetical protein